jgi:RimJ/RimL family protein N-acetyltransferase
MLGESEREPRIRRGHLLPEGRTFYGGIAINQINREHEFGNIGYWVRQSRQRRGIALRAVPGNRRFRLQLFSS